jgi:hypothetical protein
MPYTIIFNPETHVIESKFQGQLTFAEVKGFISEASLVAKEHGCLLFLSDYREAALSLSTMEIYEVPKIMKDTFASLGINANHLKRAVVVANDLDDYLFYETVTVNSGQNAQVFYDIDKAKNWLSTV